MELGNRRSSRSDGSHAGAGSSPTLGHSLLTTCVRTAASRWRAIWLCYSFPRPLSPLIEHDDSTGQAVCQDDRWASMPV